MTDRASMMSVEQAQGILGAAAAATEQEIRAAYLQKVRQHPPDRDPEQFEQIREAYDLLRDPKRRTELLLVGPDPTTPLTELLRDLPRKERRYVGPDAWLAVFKEKRK